MMKATLLPLMLWVVAALILGVRAEYGDVDKWSPLRRVILATLAGVNGSLGILLFGYLMKCLVVIH
jgi:hypothetical protein